MGLSHGAIIVFVILGCGAFVICGAGISSIARRHGTTEEGEYIPEHQMRPSGNDQIHYMAQVREGNMQLMASHAGRAGHAYLMGHRAEMGGSRGALSEGSAAF